GTIGDHGVAVLSKREGLTFDTEIVSDAAALHTLVAAMIKVAPNIHTMRDPTRGGLATLLNEIAQESGVGIVIQENEVPVAPAVQGACELLGLDPLYVANEGKLVAFCPQDEAEALLAAMRAHPLGRRASIIGTVVDDQDRFVQMETSFGGCRLVDWLVGEQLPRIC
ncbi:MAG: hydrogenase expression/formation protein HypE, partial [Rhodospirillales bacterium]|nr:hydrogenase expression/formation protein HypE [Rhodospirillales bacterium]